MKRFGMAGSLAAHPAPQIERLERRPFLRRGVSAGALAVVPGWLATEGQHGR